MINTSGSSSSGIRPSQNSEPIKILTSVILDAKYRLANPNRNLIEEYAYGGTFILNSSIF